MARYSQRTEQIATTVHKLTLFLVIYHILICQQCGLLLQAVFAAGPVCSSMQHGPQPYPGWSGKKEVQSGKLRNQRQA